MTKAIRFDRVGGPEVLHFADIEDRQPAAGEVSLEIEAVGLNRAESAYYHGAYIDEQPKLPSGLGYEAVGTVTAAGPGVDPSLVGRRFGTIPGYSMNQYAVLAERGVVPGACWHPYRRASRPRKALRSGCSTARPTARWCPSAE